MTQLLELELYQFFALKHVTIQLKNQGRVLVVGPNGAGKTAILIEGPYYALFGQSFEYGPRPGDNIGNRFQKSFLTRIDFEADGHIYRVIRTQGVRENNGIRLPRNGVYLFKQAERDMMKWEDRSLSKAADTQDAINALVGMTPLTFTNTTTFSSDVLRLPDFPDAEKKRIINDLLGVGSCDVALKDTTKRLSDITQEITLKDSMLSVTSNSLRDANKRIVTLEESVANWEEEVARKVQEHATKKERLAAELKVKEDAAVLLSVKLTDCMQAAGAAAESIATIKTLLQKIDGIVDRSRAARPGIGESPSIRQKLEAAQSGACSECGRPFDENQDPEAHGKHVKKLQEDLKAALLKEKQEMTDWKTTDDAVLQRRAKEKRNLEAAELDLTAHQETRRKLERQQAELDARIFSLKEQLEQADEDPPSQQTNPHEALLKAAVEERDAYQESVTKTSEQLAELRVRLADEKLMQELFGQRGCRVNRLESALPFLNEKCEEVAAALKIELRVSFVIRGENEAYANTVDVVVDNPAGAGQYHGNSAGERRLADLVILFSLLSLATANHGEIGQAFFDETFEKLFPAIKNNVMRVIGAINSRRNSVFIISHITEGLDLDQIDQIWNVANGEVEVTHNRV